MIPSEAIGQSSQIMKQDGPIALLKVGSRRTWNTVGRPISRLPVIDRLCYQLSVSKLRDRMDSERSLEEIMETCYNYRGFGQYKSIRPQQVPEELTALAREIKRLNPDSILEVGTASGGSYYIWCRFLDVKKIVCVDFSLTEEYIRFLDQFGPNIETRFLIENSLHNRTVKMVGENAGDGYDFIFIDGAGSYDAKMADFENYSQYLSDDGIIAYHDICERPDSPKSEGHKFWKDIKQEYDTREIVGPPNHAFRGEDIHLGIGIIYP